MPIKGSKQWNEQLGMTDIVVKGVLFATGIPVVFPYLRNTVPSPYFGDMFQQDIEPYGRFMVFDDSPDRMPPEDPSGRMEWTQGVQEFECPLVIWFNTENTEDVLYDDFSWKSRLHRLFKGKKKSLTRKLKSDGYDGIVTVTSGRYGTVKEIVAL